MDHRYTVRVKLAVEFDVDTTAQDSRQAAHRATTQVLLALEGHADPPTLVDHEILFAHTTRRTQPAGKGQGE